MKFDSSAAKLVNLVVILAQLISSSLALPAQLVFFCFFTIEKRLEYLPARKAVRVAGCTNDACGHFVKTLLLLFYDIWRKNTLLSG